MQVGSHNKNTLLLYNPKISMKEILYALKGMFHKVFYILKEMFYMVKKYKLYFLAPIFIVLAFLAFLVYYIGPTVIISFIYAGV